MRALLAHLHVEFLLAFRRGESVLITLVVPVVLLLFFGSIIDTPTDFLVPGILALAVMSTSLVSLGIATAYERYYGALKRLLGSPLPRSSLLTAKTLAIIAIEAVQVAVLVAVARLVYGWSPPDASPLLAVFALVLGSAAFAGLGLLLAGTLRAEATLAVANGLYLVLLLLGGFVVPLERLPEPVAAVARVLPAGALTDAVRGALGGDQGVVGSLALLAAWAVGGIGAAAVTFRAE